mmetsp:Transcript_21434/g.27735  ORF Transcript_21434/g.27735 Transcript_21434/m.27735 type:complete len:105 (+) Transcript_21434:682-996(+)
MTAATSQEFQGGARRSVLVIGPTPPSRPKSCSHRHDCCTVETVVPAFAAVGCQCECELARSACWLQLSVSPVGLQPRAGSIVGQSQLRGYTDGRLLPNHQLKPY